MTAIAVPLPRRRRRRRRPPTPRERMAMVGLGIHMLATTVSVLLMFWFLRRGDAFAAGIQLPPIAFNGYIGSQHWRTVRNYIANGWVDD